MKTISISLFIVALLAGCRTIPPADYTNQSGSCELHNLVMEKETVRIIRGFPSEQMKDEYIASEAAFPHGLDFVIGTHVKEKKDPDQALIYVCPECVRAKNEWIKRVGVVRTTKEVYRILYPDDYLGDDETDQKK